MATLEEARHAKVSLKERLGRPEWLRGVGIGNDPTKGFVVHVNIDVLTDEIRSTVPASINGVQVEVHVTDEVKTFTAGHRVS